jgi:CubicO group peptidase (beta-lactamase class C family)
LTWKQYVDINVSCQDARGEASTAEHRDGGTRCSTVRAFPGRSCRGPNGSPPSFIVDPAADLVAILLVQRLMRGPNDMALNEEFLTLAYQAIED